MQIGVITVDGRMVGVITQSMGDDVDTFTPDLGGYEPMGRAAEAPRGYRTMPGAPVGHHGAPDHQGGYYRHHAPGHTDGHDIKPYSEGGRPVRQGSAEVDQAIVEASRAHHLDPNTMRSIASIESSMNPGSNYNRGTQYKGLYQIGHDEWRRFGQGNIYNAHDNAMAAARMFEANRNAFRETHGGREPTDAELYMLHQQGLGFTTPGIKRGQNAAGITNEYGNPYPGMRGPQTRESFQAGWGAEVARRKAAFARSHPDVAAEPRPTAEPPGDL